MSQYTRTNYPGHRGPANSQRYPQVSIREMAYWHPGSVYESLLGRADWISKLGISILAKKLSRMRPRQFRHAVTRLTPPGKRITRQEVYTAFGVVHV